MSGGIVTPIAPHIAHDDNNVVEKPDFVRRLIDDHLPAIESVIRLNAEERAKKEQRSEPSAMDCMKAVQEYMPGTPIVPEKPKWVWLNQNVTGFMVITALMALTFGVIGTRGDGAGAAAALEIAKIFAGALVGGAAGAGAAAAATRR